MRILLEVKRRDSNAIKLRFSGIWDQLFKPVDPGEKIRGAIRKTSSKVYVENLSWSLYINWDHEHDALFIVSRIFPKTGNNVDRRNFFALGFC